MPVAFCSWGLWKILNKSNSKHEETIKKKKLNSSLLQLRPDASKTQHANNDMKRKGKNTPKTWAYITLHCKHRQLNTQQLSRHSHYTSLRSTIWGARVADDKHVIIHSLVDARYSRWTRNSKWLPDVILTFAQTVLKLVLAGMTKHLAVYKKEIYI